MNTAQKQSSTQGTNTSKNLRVLIVDDDVSSTLLLQKALKAACDDVKIDLAEDGEHAVKDLAEKEYDLVFMDHDMPDLKGPEIVRMADMAMTKLPELRRHKTSVVTYTAHRWQDWDTEKLQYINVTGHIDKGLSFTKMKGEICECIKEPLLKIVH
jgi:CheY-like chemotaxis protein